MTEQHILTPAAVSDDVTPPREPRANEKQLLLLVAITASLPRVLWGLTIDATRFMNESWSDIGVVFDFLRYAGALIDIGCLVIVGMLAPLDKIVPGTNGKRIAVLVLGGADICFTFLPLYAVLPTPMLGIVPGLAASAAFAIWLAALLKPAGKPPMLIWVLASATVFNVVGHYVSGGFPFIGTITGILVAVEVLRARKAIE